MGYGLILRDFMLRLMDRRYRLCDGITRREAMQIGGLSALGLCTPKNCPGGDGRVPVKAKSVILFWLTGGPPQHETWDPKPNAPEEIRGEFGSGIGTSVPGIHIGELMPLTSKLVNHLAILRAVVSRDQAHSSSGYQMLTGYPHQPLSQENATARSPNYRPCLGALVRRFLPDSQGLPSAITLPRHIANVGEIVWPGQDAGYLGRAYDPWLLTCDPSVQNFQIPALALPDEVEMNRMQDRRKLLRALESHDDFLRQSYSVESLEGLSQQAYDLVSDPKSRSAFQLDQESAQTRDRYGRSKFAQSVLLARRLVEVGVKLIQVNWQQIDGKPNNGSWDTHKKHNQSLKGHLMPIMDQSFSALLEDLRQRGLLEETLVAWVGEFGHTPKFNNDGGRDHWGHVFSVALAGAGIQGGTVVGESDRHAAYPIAGRVTPGDVTATILHCLGLSADLDYRDPLGRPLRVYHGSAIREILT